MTNMSRMFYGNQATTLDVSSFVTSKVTSMNKMFASSKATILDLSNFDMTNVTSSADMFNNAAATTGYGNTANIDILNATTNKPSTLNFVIK